MLQHSKTHRPNRPRARAPRPWLAALWSGLRDEGGSTATEYALFMALVVGGAMLGSELLGLTVRKAFGGTAGSLADARREQLHPLAVKREPSASFPPVEQPMSPQESIVLWSQYGVLALGLVGGGLIWRQLYRQHKPAQASPTPEVSRASRVEVDSAGLFHKRQEILRLMSGDMEHVLHGEVQVGQIMTRRLTTVTPETPLARVHELIREGKLRHLLVIDARGRLRGVISDRDLGQKQARTAAELMTANPHTIRPDSSINPAVTLLINERISCLPVVDADKLVGVLTTTDLIMTMQCTLQLLYKIAHEINAPTTSPVAISLALSQTSDAEQLVGTP